MARAKLSKNEKIRRALKKDPDLDVKALAEKVGCKPTTVYQQRRNIRATNGTYTPWRYRKRNKPDAVTFQPAAETPTRQPRRASFAAQVGLLETMGVERVELILKLLRS